MKPEVLAHVKKLTAAIDVIPVIDPEKGKPLKEGLMTWVILIAPDRKTQKPRLLLARVNAYTGHLASIVPLPMKKPELFIETLEEAYTKLLGKPPTTSTQRIINILRSVPPEQLKSLMLSLFKELSGAEHSYN